MLVVGDVVFLALQTPFDDFFFFRVVADAAEEVHFGPSGLDQGVGKVLRGVNQPAMEGGVGLVATDHFGRPVREFRRTYPHNIINHEIVTALAKLRRAVLTLAFAVVRF